MYHQKHISPAHSYHAAGGFSIFAIAYRREGQSLSPTQIWRYLQFTQIVQLCKCVVTGRCGHRPLQTLCGLALVRSCPWVRAAGRTEASAPTDAYRFALVHQNRQRCTAREGQAPPLHYDEIITYSLFTITSYPSCPSPTLRLKTSNIHKNARRLLPAGVPYLYSFISFRRAMLIVPSCMELIHCKLLPQP